ncbi:hypothetical protein LBMAG42_16020 [Deltaproteobacteria bacterium]|nr:hypothetical protein LBMAG42_16020 [Deltaproteobacteria bacterium]
MLALLLTTLFAHAESLPVVIRFDSNGASFTAPLVVKITVDGKPAEVTLGDDGERPDFAKGDGRYAAVSQAEGEKVELELSAGGKLLGKTSAVFQDPTSPHDIDLSLADGSLTAVVSAPPSPNGDGSAAGPGGAAGGDPSGEGGPPGGGLGGGAPVDGSSPPSGTPPNGDLSGGGGPGGGGPGSGGPGGGGGPGGSSSPGSNKAPPVTFAASGSDDGVMFIAFGVGLLVLLGVVWFWKRAKGGPRSRTADVQMVPEPGLFSPSLPSLSDGLIAWVVPEGAAAVVQPLLAQLADRHRVLVIARAEVDVKPVVGGPVFRVVGVRPSLVGDVAESLEQESGPPLCVLLVLESADAEALRDYRDLLPPTVGGVVVLRNDVETSLPRVFVTSNDAGWTLKHGEATVDVVIGSRGLEAAP